MYTELITEHIWKRLTSIVKESKTKSFVAVAYFGQGGAKMLPLSTGSVLVVDASEKCVRAGQTCPSELLKLYYKGVKIYSNPHLHAKLFAIDNSLFIGSTNVSSNSSTILIEALFQTTEKKSIEAAKRFIKSLCDIELGFDLLNRLNRIYRPPLPFGNKKMEVENKISNKTNSRPFHTYHLKVMKFNKEEEKQSKLGKKEALSKLINKSRHSVDEFKWEGKFAPQKNDIILQIVDEGSKKYVVPPGILIHTRKYKNSIFCYLEIPKKNRRQISRVQKQLSISEKKELQKNGKRSKEFAEKVNSLFL